MKQKVLIIGDVMLDSHTVGRVSRISPEAPVPVIKCDLEERISLGAAANVAVQIAEDGYEVILAYKRFCINETDPRDQGGWLNLQKMESPKSVSNRLMAKNVEPFPLFYTGVYAPTTVKERIWTGQQQICRVDYEDPRKPTQEIEAVWIRQLKELVEDKDINCVVFSDYDKGTLTDRIIQKVADLIDTGTGLTILDPKRHSYWGLQGLSIIKPNKNEIDITHRSVQEISEELDKTLLLNTLSEDGMKLWVSGRHIHSERVFVEEKDVKDVCGCGDTTTAFLTIALLRGEVIERAMRVASLAAGVNTKYRGCHVLDETEINEVFGG